MPARRDADPSDPTHPPDPKATPRRRVTSIAAWAGAGLVLVALSGCAGSGGGPGRPFPAGLTADGPDRVEDVQVVRDSTWITLTNTTARPLPASTLWLNRRFARDIDALPVGQSLSLPLRSFRDEFGTPFRAGGFFATEQPERVVLAELEPRPATPDAEPELIGLVVVAGEGQ